MTRYWLTNDPMILSLCDSHGRLGTVEFNNDNQMWYGFDYTHPISERPGCRTVGPFSLAELAQDALEKVVVR